MRITNISIILFIWTGICCSSVYDIADDRQLFLDRSLIEHVENVELRMHHPQPAEKILFFDKPWEGPFSGCYFSVIKEDNYFRMYYRGANSTKHQVTCLAESKDGIKWIKPNLYLYSFDGNKRNNIVFSSDDTAAHNFSPFIDNNPNCLPEQRYKAIGGLYEDGISGFVSPDGIHWSEVDKHPLFENPPYLAFDSQNVVFWSDVEKKYICYCRIWPDVDPQNIDISNSIRRVGRLTSVDFMNWSPIKPMQLLHDGQNVPDQHLYTNQTYPYFRAPHIYIATAARFMPNRSVIDKSEAKTIGVKPNYVNDCSDVILLSTRAGEDNYTQTYLSSFLRPGYGLENWVSRTNFPAQNIIQTGESEMSMYVCKNYAQPTSHIQRYSLRIDGFSSIHADYEAGKLLTKPLTFCGDKLELNFWTSAAGFIKVEIQDNDGNPINGFTLLDCQEIIGNNVSYVVQWRNTSDISSLAGKKVRLLFQLKDADIYSFVFRGVN